MIEKKQNSLVHHHHHKINRTHATHNWHLHSCTEIISHVRVPLSLWVHPSASLPLNTMFQLELMQSICQKGRGGGGRTNITCKASLCNNSYQSWHPPGISWFDSEPFRTKIKTASRWSLSAASASIQYRASSHHQLHHRHINTNDKDLTARHHPP